MLDNLFSLPLPEPPTPFELDINNLVEKLKVEVRDIYRRYKLSSYIGLWWIYGNNSENQEMFLFEKFADPIVRKYSHSLKEREPKNIKEAYEYLKQQENNNYSNYKNLAVEVVQWIYDTISISERENLDEVLREIESLKIRLCDFKDRKPF
ncbi:hypothetical protein [Nostoc commune]|uniref:hypothetical protein n=1 Tax=Nostoc commune TaxID=1178 RepID=UPI0018C49348|nr:hypothetical protein [Nostoc commune]MBG1262515.1 hypothetical protein [Nostoc commune BAE]